MECRRNVAMEAAGGVIAGAGLGSGSMSSVPAGHPDRVRLGVGGPRVARPIRLPLLAVAAARARGTRRLQVRVDRAGEARAPVARTLMSEAIA